MATQNRRGCAYFTPPIYEKLRELTQTHGITESRAIAAIVELYFGEDPAELKRVPMTPEMDERLTRLEREVVELREAIAKKESNSAFSR